MDETPDEHLVVDDLKKVCLTLTVDLGETAITVRDVLNLKQGTVIQLSKPAGEMTDVFVNGIPLAKGEIVVIADARHVRVAEIFGATLVEEKEG
ncbi:MAG: FliM/FliN family flagellar motor C-terminal domain-containing protein, partial [Candidatus Hydrogenedentes bacterium]|nr:FliM/FliN family flagellar motor C-terminal domain-containing protein [Candidatus Hydrogenedentota bacterium]